MSAGALAPGLSVVGGSGLFAELRWTPVRIAVAAAAGIIALALLYRAGRYLLRVYPGSYVWSDLLISYQGGPVRRGLLGEVAFLLHPLIDPHILLPALVIGLYLAICGALIVLVCGQLRISGLLFLASPAALVMPLVDLGGFGRKEILFVAAFILCVLVVCRMRRAEVALAIIMATYLVMGLVHELAWLYFPLAVAVLLHTSARQKWRRWILGAVVVSGLYLVAMTVLVIQLKGDATGVNQMMAAWQAVVPDAFAEPKAAGFLGLPPEASVPVMLEVIASPLTFTSYVVGFLLALVPIGAWFIERRVVPHPVLGLGAGSWGRA